MNDEIRKIVEELTSEKTSVPVSSASASENSWAEFDNQAPDLLYCEEDSKGSRQCVVKMSNTVDGFVTVGADRISAERGEGKLDVSVAKLIDHTALKADLKVEDIVQLCMEAREYSFASVCVNPGFVKLAADILAGSTVRVCTVVGFPLGATTSETKAFEAKQAVQNGATEVDMVINVSALKSGRVQDVESDIRTVRQAIPGVTLKVIIETCYLTETEKISACVAAKNAKADYVKTSTGFGTGGATAEDIAIMRRTVGREMGVKASGGVRDFNGVLEMVKAGATRIGASASIAIVEKKTSKSDY